MARPVIALLTDFGLRDHYVAAMKGVILGICPEAALIDISHEIPPQDVLAGALEIEAVVPYLPSGTIVVGVVDPGVGSARRGVALESNGLFFVGPDNGLFSLVHGGRLPAGDAVSIEDQRFTRDTVSRTFEGRDRFAPVAAWLARGTPLSRLGPRVDDLVHLNAPAARSSREGIDGAVLRIDRFGNLVTNIDQQALKGLGDNVLVRIAGATIAGISRTYADAAHGALCALVGSTERLEISVNGGSAAAVLGAARGAAVQIRPRSAA